MRRGRPRTADILTPREWEVLQLIAEGLTNEQIGDRLGISLSAAKYHVGEILSKLHASSRQDAVQIAHRHRSGLPVLVPLTWLRDALLAKPLLTSVATAVVATAVALALTTPWTNESSVPYLGANNTSAAGPDLAAVDEDAFDRVRLASPFPHAVLLTKNDPQYLDEAGPIVASLARVASLSELQRVLSDEINVIVIDVSAADEVTGSDFLARELVGGRAIIELNVCLEEVHFSGGTYPEPERRDGVVTEISPSGEKLEIIVSANDPPRSICDIPLAQATGVFNFRRMTIPEHLESVRPGENPFGATGGGRFIMFESVLRDFDAARQLSDWP
jgi:DNA-binding CsgD family transcriptional regulator